uniref:Uncharacterized protein n=1 Tax=Hemiselmis andersenii TaxID=464988 RepID=A0A6T8K154_HEMAN|mmetsp:Transcript_24122/g.55995  ORF Transcript_24122/g.55995 Transcript_24122/m.55995 type:complete len:470 (+) Transcript_24122:20-1429(+)
MSLTSDELNYLVYRYLLESGYTHTAFSFANESLVTKANINGADVPPGSLISFVQKGMMYVEIEQHINDDGTEIDTGDDKMSLLLPGHLQARDEEKSETAEAMDEDGTEIEAGKVTTLSGHESEVFTVAWNPVKSLLASGSGDSSARIWHIPTTDSGAEAERNVQWHILEHFNAASNEKAKDVTTLDWNSEGTLLATGSYDGQARIWNEQGKLVMTLNKHKGPVFSLKWNRTGSLLLSGSVDKTSIVWDTKTGDVVQQFVFHSAPTLDVDWRNSNSFATCSTDKTIYVCKIGEDQPVKRFQGHSDEVNAIKWDPTGTMLASCSDDFSAKVWSVKQDEPLHDFRLHTKEIYTIKWSPTGPGTKNPGKPLLLATASFDSTVKLWNIELGECVQTLSRHSEPVYSVAFNPTGDFIASGSFDKCLHVWSVKEGSLVRTYRGSSGIFEVAWNASGDKVAACFFSKVVAVVDFKAA